MPTKRQKQESLGPKLRRIREEKGLGIKTAGKKLDISYTYLSKVENGHKIPSIELIDRLSSLYGVSPDTLLASIAQLPDDIQQIIKENGSEVFELLRSTYLVRPTPADKKVGGNNDGK